jgi:rubredoxin
VISTMWKCPYCDFSGKRSEIHNHLAENHGDTLGSRVDEFTGHTFYIVTCPVCGASYEQVTKKARRDPSFVQEYEHEIRMVVFDLLLYHLQGEHGEGPVVE